MTLPDNESILVVDDQPSACETLKTFLLKQGYRVSSCSSAAEALEHLGRDHFDLVLTDVCMPKMSGLDLLKEVVQRGRNEEVVVMTAFATIDQSVEAMRRGASDYITKPFRLEDLANTIAQALKRRQQRLSSPKYDTDSRVADSGGSIVSPANRWRIPVVGNSPLMRRVFTMIERVAPSDSSVLIVGATGTGKELVARQIHEQSDRRHKPFVDINCSAIPETLIEAELFGHERGTFTGATETRPGLFEEASGGSLFLDEVDALHHSAQAKLLRVLQERQVRRVGGRKNIPVDVRIIAATNKDIQRAVANGTFRHDLMYRLSVVPIKVPELFERRDDIPLLVQLFLKRHAARRGTAPKKIAPEALKSLMKYRWPGNVRELENAIEYALVVSEGNCIELYDLPATVGTRTDEKDVPHLISDCLEHNAPLSEVERRYVQVMLEKYQGHQINTAAALGIDRRTLYRKLQQYQLNNRLEPSV